jgi:hypothetical protein
MVPVAVSVPQTLDISIVMELDSWAFGKITGSPVN